MLEVNELCNSAYKPRCSSDGNLFAWVERDTEGELSCTECSAQCPRPGVEPGVAHANHEAAARFSRTLCTKLLFS